MSQQDYRDTLDYLFGRLDYERLGMPRSVGDLRLGRMRRLLRSLGDPQDALRIVHVAGTKGKGSTAAMIAAATTAAGIKTGLFTSPHLHRLEERFRVDGKEATAADMVTLVEMVRPHVERLDRDDPHFVEGGGATFFEITTAMGLLYFRLHGAGLVLLEVGMGGRLDSTNAVHPLVSVITTISLDHTRLLGSTPGAIAAEKAGIIKRGRPVVSGVRDEDARSVIARIAAARRSPLRAIDVDFRYEFEPPGLPFTRPEAGRARVATWRSDWGSVELPLMGEHQALNASVALATLDVLGEHGITIGRNAVDDGFARLDWPARTEILGERPWIVVDGAHNPASAVALAETLRTCFPPGPRTLIFGATREKDFRGQLEALLPSFARVICTRYLNNPRALPPDAAADTVIALGRPRPLVVDDAASALTLARSITPDDGLVCVTGSLFLAAEMRAVILGIPEESAPLPT
jgi:dihydrofolate synthase/folylpolyglutamate synthase